MAYIAFELTCLACTDLQDHKITSKTAATEAATAGSKQDKTAAVATLEASLLSSLGFKKEPAAARNSRRQQQASRRCDKNAWLLKGLALGLPTTFTTRPANRDAPVRLKQLNTCRQNKLLPVCFNNEVPAYYPKLAFNCSRITKVIVTRGPTRPKFGQKPLYKESKPS